MGNINIPASEYESHRQQFSSDELAKFKSLIKQQASAVYDYQVGTYVPKPDKIITLLQEDGIYDIRENQIAKFITQKSSQRFSGLPSSVKQSMELKIPKAPISVFWDIVYFYRTVHAKLGTEVASYVFYNQNDNTFFHYVPNQVISAASVHYKNEEDPKLREYMATYYPFIECHSHHTLGLGAKFSSIDNNDKKDWTWFDMVIGHIDRFFPDFAIRYAIDGEFFDIGLDEIFDTSSMAPKRTGQFKDWEAKCKLYTQPYSTRFYNGSGYSLDDISNNVEEEHPMKRYEDLWKEVKHNEKIEGFIDDELVQYNAERNFTSPIQSKTIRELD